ncbi:MAG TPA: signal recognition particle-docking protein FtsY, partial [Ramlibacter sp.]
MPPAIPAPTAAPARSGGLIGSALVAPMEIPAAVAELPPERQSWMEKLSAGLRKTGTSISQVFTGATIDDALYEELETALLLADT